MATVPRAKRKRRTNPEGRMAVMDHLRELRRRVIIMLLIIAVGAIVGWVFYDHVLEFLRKPYCSVPTKYRFHPDGEKSCSLVYTGVLDGFTTRLKVSVIAGAVATGPFWLYQIWAFITPGLRKNERKYTLIFVVTSTVLFACGMALAYLMLFKGLPLLLAQSGTGTQALLTLNAYISFVTLMIVVFGAAFEVPLLVVMANFAGVLPSRLLKKSQRVAIFLIFVFAAVATPTTDPFTMLGMAVPMVLLFEGAVAIATVHDRRKARRKEAEKAAAAAAGEELADDQPSSVDPVPKALDWSDST
jgi:sec-independent protein translocase protein TatC